MPFRDKTGPQGKGLLTGRGFGPCGKGLGKGFNMDKSKEKLDLYRKNLESELEQVKVELEKIK